MKFDLKIEIIDFLTGYYNFYVAITIIIYDLLT
jgi:hypothetical protein